MSNDQSDKTMLQSITQLINSIGNQGISCDVIVQILSLLCLFCIVNRSQGTLNSISTSIPNASTSPLQKLVGDLMKKDGETSPPPDMLATLLPLLNNPQVKSKLTPTNICQRRIKFDRNAGWKLTHFAGGLKRRILLTPVRVSPVYPWWRYQPVAQSLSQLLTYPLICKFRREY